MVSLSQQRHKSDDVTESVHLPAAVSQVEPLSSSDEDDSRELYVGPGTPQRSRTLARRKETIPQIPKGVHYDGKGNWKAFLKRYTMFGDALEWSAKERKKYMCWCLEGKAADYYSNLLDRDEHITYRSLLDKLERRFGFRDLPEMALVEFNQSRQETGETLEDWADRALTLATAAFRTISDTHVYQQAVIKFCQGCLDEDAALYASNTRPRSVEDALDKVKRYQHNRSAVWGQAPRKRVNFVGSESEDESLSVRAATREVRFNSATSPVLRTTMEDRITKLEEQLTTVITSLNKLSGRPRMRSRSPSPGGSNCYYCGQMGHFKRDCPKIGNNWSDSEEKNRDLNDQGSAKKA